MDERYRLFGEVVQWSLAQGGPGIPVLSPVQYDLMNGVDHQKNIDEEIKQFSEPLQHKIVKVLFTYYYKRSLHFIDVQYYYFAGVGIMCIVITYVGLNA